MTEKDIKQQYDLACTYLKNKQTTSAHSIFLDLAQKEQKVNDARAGLFFMLAAECRSQQGKDSRDEILQAGNFYLRLAAKEKSYAAKSSYLCAAKCFLRIGEYETAKGAFEKSKKTIAQVVEKKRPVIIVEDSPSIIMKLTSYLEKLGYHSVHAFKTGKDAISSCKKLIQSSQNPIVLLDMGLPDIDGDVVANKLLESKLDLSIILITADDKTSPRVHKTISLGATAFIQKPFTIDDLKNALVTAESG